MALLTPEVIVALSKEDVHKMLATEIASYWDKELASAISGEASPIFYAEKSRCVPRRLNYLSIFKYVQRSKSKRWKLVMR